MQQRATRPCISAGVALVGVGVIAVSPVAVPPPDVQAPDIQLTSGTEDMVLDLVRHGESTANAAGITGNMSTTPPGAHLTDLGEQQAHDVATALQQEFPNDVDAIYASEFARTQETAAPFAALEQMDVHDLAGLNEINAGIFDGTPKIIGGLPYAVAFLSWSLLGQYWVPMIGSTSNPNGMAFEDRFNDAIQTIYHAGGPTTDGELHDVAFSHGGAILAWTLMNVKNPDLSVILPNGELPNTGQVVIEGNPTDGWTLVSWAGHDVSQTPDLGTALFVDFRDLITAPQMALWHIWEAIQGGDPDTISAALQTGLDQVSTAIAQFPESVWDDIAGVLQDGALAAI